jgi:hypothetical protein
MLLAGSVHDERGLDAARQVVANDDVVELRNAGGF